MMNGARGLSVLFASGDQGVWGRTGHSETIPGFHPDFPAGSPYITAVGGTQFATTSVLGDETTWADGGGGFSDTFAAPDYQLDAVKSYFSSGVDLPPSSDYNATGRGYPDVAALENEVRRLHAVIAAGRQETLIMHEDDVGGAADARPLAVEQSAVAVDADAMPDHEEDKITIKRLQVRVCRLATLATRNNTHKRTHAHAHMHHRCSCGKHANGRRSFVTSCCASVPAFAPKATSTRACATPSRARSKQPEKACPSTPLSRTCCPMRSWRLRFDRTRPTALQTGMPRLRKATSSCRPG